MKKMYLQWLALMCTVPFSLFAIVPFSPVAPQPHIENVIIITTDGFRWQEVFKGMDSTIAEMDKFNQERKKEIYAKYGANTAQERRKKLLPFLWTTLGSQGELFGNRTLGNKVNVTNPYWFSYPGYSEIFCGYVDTLINTNHYKANPNTTLLEFLNQQPAYHNKVAAFAEWDAFDKILNSKRAGFPVYCGADVTSFTHDSAQSLINLMKADSYLPFDSTSYLDVFTQYSAMNYLQKKHPKVMYISYGETDEWAHEGHYLDYLDAAHRVDKWIGDLWNYIQRTPQYKDKTLLMVTCDHGRGDSDKTKWTSHNAKIVGANEIWLGLIGPGIQPTGEQTKDGQIYQAQYAQTIAHFLGLDFKCEHPVMKAIEFTH